MARIELSAEVKAIESLIDAGQQGDAANRLQAVHANLGRRPEYRTQPSGFTDSAAGDAFG